MLAQARPTRDEVLEATLADAERLRELAPMVAALNALPASASPALA
jgi:hypothetical protein